MKLQREEAAGLEESGRPSCERGPMGRRYRPVGGENSFWSTTSKRKGTSVILLRGSELCQGPVSSEQDSGDHHSLHQPGRLQPGKVLGRGPSQRIPWLLTHVTEIIHHVLCHKVRDNLHTAIETEADSDTWHSNIKVKEDSLYSSDTWQSNIKIK